MPKVEIYKSDLNKLIGRNLNLKKLDELFVNYLKAEIDGVDGDKLVIDLDDTNRPDTWAVEFMAHIFKGILGIEKGFKLPNVKPSGIKIKANVPYRPYIAAVLVEGISLNEKIIDTFKSFQEKINLSYGRKRKKLAIGAYDYDKINSKFIEYKLISRNELIQPLGFSEEVTIQEMLETHEKGKEFSDLVKTKVPGLIANGKLLSVPPIVNDERYKITKNTKRILVDVTGVDIAYVEFIASLIGYQFFLRGAKIKSVAIQYKNGKSITPKYKVKKMKIKLEDVNNYLGLKLNERELKKLLQSMRYNYSNGVVEIPPYRLDVMDDIDVFEDVIIAKGLNNIEPLPITFFSVGKLSDVTKKINFIREKLIGAGFQEINTYILTNKKILDAVGFKGIELKNPCNANYTHVRSTLIGSFLEFLSKNKTVEYPHKIFEVGKVFENGKEKWKVCVAISHSKVTYTEIRQIYDLLSKEKISECKHKLFIDGRCAKSKKAIFGEVHPSVLEFFGIEMPVVILEMEL